MNRLPATFHRLSIALIALALIAVGGSAIAWRASIHPVHEWIDRIDETAISRSIAQQWWMWVLIAVAVVAVGWGLLLISTNIAPRAVDDVTLPDSDETGALTIAPKLIAAAVTDELEGDPPLHKVSATAIDDRARSIIRVVVTARPNRSYDEISGPVEAAVESIKTALGASDVHVQAFVHFEK
ncbi:hypothetical protein RD149_17935 [Gordonia westfalica]|uniref:Alkaline shock response membrane anchor protein AmaP n=1 Tax=Gordonia westfalica TaxID=158898 RepID=A0ABU2GXJ5_9ACTN|nr:hypothetical protein [Gordonia westfalica]MDS1115635.1 hypothetical protein [Gordonia westfalica]